MQMQKTIYALCASVYHSSVVGYILLCGLIIGLGGILIVLYKPERWPYCRSEVFFFPGLLLATAAIGLYWHSGWEFTSCYYEPQSNMVFLGIILASVGAGFFLFNGIRHEIKERRYFMGSVFMLLAFIVLFPTLLLFAYILCAGSQ